MKENPTSAHERSSAAVLIIDVTYWQSRQNFLITNDGLGAITYLSSHQLRMAVFNTKPCFSK
jgi:hypothetical protein